MKKSLLILTFVLSLFVAGVFILYIILGQGHLLPAFFIGLGISVADKGKIRQLPNYLCSIIAGLVWSFFYTLINQFLIIIGIPPSVSMFIGMFVFVFLAISLHLVVLDKTLLNSVPLVFAAITAQFLFPDTQQYIGVFISLTLGVLVAVLSGPIAGLLEKGHKQKIESP